MKLCMSPLIIPEKLKMILGKLPKKWTGLWTNIWFVPERWLRKYLEIRIKNILASWRTVFVPCWPYASCIMASQRPQNNEVIPYALGFAHVMHLNSASPAERFYIWLDHRFGICPEKGRQQCTFYVKEPVLFKKNQIILIKI